MGIEPGTEPGITEAGTEQRVRLGSTMPGTEPGRAMLAWNQAALNQMLNQAQNLTGQHQMVLLHGALNRVLNQAQCQAAPHQHQTGQRCAGHCHTGHCAGHRDTERRTGHHGSRHCGRLHCAMCNHTGHDHHIALGASPQQAPQWAPLHQALHCHPALQHCPTASPYTSTQHPTPLLPHCTPPPIPPQHPTLPPSVTLCRVLTLHPAALHTCSLCQQTPGKVHICPPGHWHCSSVPLALVRDSSCTQPVLPPREPVPRVRVPPSAHG